MYYDYVCDLEEYFRKNPLKVDDLVNHPTFLSLVEKHKMPILQGLARFKRHHLHSYETVLDALYHLFIRYKNPRAFERVCVLLTGAGLVNVQGRIAFCQALNGFCSTLAQLYYYEVDAGTLPVFTKSLAFPTYGRQISLKNMHYAKFKEA